MSLQPLIFSDFAPDLDPITAGACQDMSNVYPTQSGFFRTMPGLQLVGQGLPSYCYGAYAGLLIDQPISVAATLNQLWIWQNGWYVSSAAALTATQNRRRFAIYGNIIIVVDGVNVPYYYSSGFASLAFQPIPGWPGNFGMVNPSLVETTDYATILVQANSQVLWSSLAPTGPWIPSVPAEVYQYDLGQIPGDITAVHRLRSLLVVYRQNAFQCATFVGVDIGWDFGSPGTISENIGAAGNECVINTGDYHYIWGPDDFWQFDGYNLNRIPNNLKEFIFRDLDQGHFALVAGRYDVNRTLVFWHYPSVNASPAGTLDSYVSLNLRTGKWGFGRLNIEIPLTGLMNDPLSSQTTPDTGVVLPDNNLYLYDEQAPFGVTRSTGSATGGIFLTTMLPLGCGELGAVEMFSLGANGTAPPITPTTTIAGASFLSNLTDLASPQGCISANGLIWVADQSTPAVLAFPVSATGNVAPSIAIKGAATTLVTPVDVAVAPNGNVYVADFGLGAILIFAAGATGNVAPIASISGAATDCPSPATVAVDSSGKIYSNGTVGGNVAVVIFAAGTTGNTAPLASITGSNTTLQNVYDVRLDPAGNVWVADSTTSDIVMFAAGHNGNIAPLGTILPPTTLGTAGSFLGLAFDSVGNSYALYMNHAGAYFILQYASGAMGNAVPEAALQVNNGAGIATFGTATPSGLTNIPTYIVSNDFGDRHMVYSTRRMRPGFSLYPVPQSSSIPTPVLITPLVQMSTTGSPPAAAPSVPISGDGWGNLKVTGRLTRFRLDLYAPAELAQGDIDINATGAV